MAKRRSLSRKATKKTKPTSKNENPLKAYVTEAAKLLRAKSYPELERTLSKAAEISPEDPNVLHLKGLYYLETKRIQDAFEHVSRAAVYRPNSMAIKHNLAAIFVVMGEFKAAEKLLREAVHGNPLYAEAYHTLAPIHKFKPEDTLIPKMEKLAANPDLTPQDQSFIFFALAKAYDDIGDADKAWPMMEKGNGLMASSYKANAENLGVGAAMGTYTDGFIRPRAAAGHPTQAPIFVVGMPRSGTTLLESLISEHPQVFGAGELTGIVNIANMMGRDLKANVVTGYAEVTAKAGPHHLYAGARGYLDSARAEASGWFDHFVDKLPDNSFSLGFIKCLLPNAQIVHIMRHPLDTMLSIYLQRFTSVPYGYRIEEISRHYRNYIRIMDHWRKTLPGTLIELRYENLVQDKDFAQRYLYKHLGLSQDIAHVPKQAKEGNQAQITASRWQVRQDVYTTSQEKWRRYERHIGPMIEAFGGMDAITTEVAAQEARCALRRSLAKANT